MLVKAAKSPFRHRPKRGECGAVFTVARDGRWCCVRKSRPVDDSFCSRCGERDWPGCGERV